MSDGMSELKIERVEQLVDYAKVPGCYRPDDNVRSKLVVMIANLLLEEDNAYARAVGKAEKIVDLIVGCFKDE